MVLIEAAPPFLGVAATTEVGSGLAGWAPLALLRVPVPLVLMTATLAAAAARGVTDVEAVGGSDDACGLAHEPKEPEVEAGIV